ncbi:MAG TPA: alpha/beta hydrolase-fold protein [Ferruginibacter sp.]|nr:alpha/beta hydrolase-fold protein [Ferruginibacter sp.]
MNRLLIISLLVCFMLKTNAQFARVNIPGSEVRTITSSIVAGQEYELHIMLPGGYTNSTKKYPVVYLMDSQWDFPLVKSIYGQQYYDGFIPELIVVGVTWGGTNPNADSLRVRDYTPTNDGRQKQGGGADQFLSFMKNELFPFIEANYKADGNNRSIMGCSLGGLITLYALFTHTDMFRGYAAASPAIGWDRELIYQYEKKFFEGNNTLPVRMYMTIGDVERSAPGFEKFAKHLESRNYSSLVSKAKLLENTGHSGTKSETYSRGLQFIFERPRLELDAVSLNRFAGMYQTTNGNKLEIKNEGGRLVLYFSPGNKYMLYAAGETEFYATTEFFNIHFQTQRGAVQGFRLDRYGSSQFITKTP